MHGTNKRHSMSISSHGEQRWGARTVDGPPARPTDRLTTAMQTNNSDDNNSNNERSERSERSDNAANEANERTNERSQPSLSRISLYSHIRICHTLVLSLSYYPYPGIYALRLVHCQPDSHSRGRGWGNQSVTWVGRWCGRKASKANKGPPSNEVG